ncbi:hypothetical protein GCM10025867_48750 (plasmid) [Frondihabitans sucicola]|uniref:UTRA domain-containing protein n=1 Tax=Frondihabitans sucicola TaxID=1268041 RepID=A0ABN6Y5P7_9MICO|nr:hypothetical protein [Frondihabitans sucicola]BDZ52634.1 hypothetical protein GCM10025867_48750 [Frondihabitans sucicola]
MSSPLSLHEPDQLALAESSGTPVEVLSALGRSRFTPVRRRVAMNGRTPDLVLDVLTLDIERDVRNQAHITVETKAILELEAIYALPSHNEERPGATA